MLKVFIDGGLKNNDMHIGILSNSARLSIKFNKRIDGGAAHTAEELALYISLKILQELNVKEELVIFTDHVSLVSLVNKKNISNNSLISYPKLNEIRTILLVNPNIKVMWIKKKNNHAHSLVVDAYANKFTNIFTYNPLKQASKLDSINEIESLINIIKSLEEALIKKDLLISELLQNINELNNSHLTCE